MITRSFSDFLEESGSINLKGIGVFTKEEIEEKLYSIKDGEYRKRDLIREIEKILDADFTESSFVKLVRQGILLKSERRGMFHLNIADIENKVDDTEIEDIEVGNSKVKDFSKIKAKKEVKYKVPKGSKNKKFEGFCKKVIKSMINTSKGREKGSLLLKGDPGTGKTSSVESFADIMGMRIITIEAPHTSEDSIISVPYLIKKGLETEEGTLEIDKSQDGDGFEVINAESSLVTDLRNKKPMKTVEWDKSVRKFKHLEKIRDEFIKPIENIRNVYTTILFIDELYRSGSPRIQNLFRTILNGYIGGTKIPKNVFIMFASNMDDTDGSLDNIPINHQFSGSKFDKPSKDDFLNYIHSKFGDDENIDSKNKELVSSEVFNKFAEKLDEVDLGGKDVDTEIRVSPRRWEEILKYVSNRLPAKSQKDAQALIHFMFNNMKNYKDGTYSKLAEKYAKVIREMIEEQSDFKVDILPPKPSDWANQFEQEIDAKMELGENRKYVVALSGKPGVGKTSMIRELANKKGLRLIEIDCSTLNSEDVVGLTTPKKVNGTLVTEFTEPPLYSRIMKNYDADYKVEGSQYTHILFLDEITRTSKRVMNSIRSLLLEKKINSNYKLEDNIMIVTALNPAGASNTGVEELSDHLADVMDIIDVESKVSELFKYINEKETNIEVNQELGFNITDKISNIVREMIGKLESEMDADGNKISGESKKWNWTWDGNIIYVSPREIDDMVSGAIGNIHSELFEFSGFNPTKNYSEEEYKEFIEIIKTEIVNKIEDLVNFIAEDKFKIPEDSVESLLAYIKETVSVANFDEIMEVNSENIQSIKTMIEDAEYDFDEMIDYGDIGSVMGQYIENNEPEVVVQNVSDVIDEIVNNFANSPTNFMNNIGGLYNLLKEIDFDKYSGKISANLTEGIKNRGIVRYANILLDIAIAEDKNFTSEIESNKYFSLFEDFSKQDNYFL